jgi:hypothetical protein
VVSPLGGPIRLANPWRAQAVTLFRNGRQAEELSGEALTFATAKGETVVVVPKGTTARTVRIN